jgi:hypothetical protein
MTRRESKDQAKTANLLSGPKNIPGRDSEIAQISRSYNAFVMVTNCSRFRSLAPCGRSRSTKWAPAYSLVVDSHSFWPLASTLPDCQMRGNACSPWRIRRSRIFGDSSPLGAARAGCSNRGRTGLFPNRVSTPKAVFRSRFRATNTPRSRADRPRRPPLRGIGSPSMSFCLLPEILGGRVRGRRI